MRALVAYDSGGGNTEKVARAIHEQLSAEGVACDLVKLDGGTDPDVLEYDLVFLGTPTISWLPTKNVIDYVKGRMSAYGKAGVVVPGCPLQPGKWSVPFCTYAGTHCGMQEAWPVTKWLSAFFGHIGYPVFDEWHFLGEFHGEHPDGRMGVVEGRPSAQDVAEVRQRIRGMMKSLAAFK